MEEGKTRRRGRERTCLSVFPTDRQNIPHHVTKFWLISLPAVKSPFLLKLLRFPTFLPTFWPNHGYQNTIQYNTIQILLSTPHGGFSETSINSTGNQKKKKDPDARQRCKASEKTQGTNCIALFFAVIPVHWQHELAQSLLLSCLWSQVKLQLYVTSVQLRQYSCMWAEEICRGRHASHLRLTREAIENTRCHFGASAAHTLNRRRMPTVFSNWVIHFTGQIDGLHVTSWWPCWWELNSIFMYYCIDTQNGCLVTWLQTKNNS